MKCFQDFIKAECVTGSLQFLSNFIKAERDAHFVLAAVCQPVSHDRDPADHLLNELLSLSRILLDLFSVSLNACWL